MAWSTFDLDNEFIISEKININNIPSLLFRPNNNKKLLPTIIYYHGWQSNKEFQRFNASILASFGYQVVVPDAIYHGERTPIDHNAPGMLEKYFWKVILHTVKESQQLIEWVLKNLNVDSKRIGLMGSSMGGFIASGVFVDNTYAKSAVIFNGSCAWNKAEEIYKYRGESSTLSPEEKADLLSYDPFQNKEKFYLRPILMLHGESDISVPIDSQRYFYNEVLSLYKEKEENIKLIEVPNMNHYISTGMFEQGIEWFKRFL